jgi:hypothetical protein
MRSSIVQADVAHELHVRPPKFERRTARGVKYEIRMIVVAGDNSEPERKTFACLQCRHAENPKHCSKSLHKHRPGH